MIKNKVSIIIAGILLLILTSCKNTSEVTELKLAHSLEIVHPVHIAMEFMADRVEELSDGQMTIQVYPSSQLGSEQQALELVQIGSLAMTKVSAAAMESFTDDYKVFGLPYIFRSKEHVFDVLDGEIGQELLLSTKNKWIRGLCYYDAGSRSFYTKDKSINHPDDLAGLKIRVMNSVTAIQMIRSLGGSATPISAGELYTALSSGVVDGAENNPPTFETSHHYEVCKYYSLDEHTTIPDVVVMSDPIWEKLTEQEREWLQQAADESVVKQRQLWHDKEIESLEKLEAAGVEITKPDKEPFIEMVQPLLESYKSNEVVNSYVERIQAVK